MIKEYRSKWPITRPKGVSQTLPCQSNMNAFKFGFNVEGTFRRKFHWKSQNFDFFQSLFLLFSNLFLILPMSLSLSLSLSFTVWSEFQYSNVLLLLLVLQYAIIAWGSSLFPTFFVVHDCYDRYWSTHWYAIYLVFEKSIIFALYFLFFLKDIQKNPMKSSLFFILNLIVHF